MFHFNIANIQILIIIFICLCNKYNCYISFFLYVGLKKAKYLYFFFNNQF